MTLKLKNIPRRKYSQSAFSCVSNSALKTTHYFLLFCIKNWGNKRWNHFPVVSLLVIVGMGFIVSSYSKVSALYSTHHCLQQTHRNGFQMLCPWGWSTRPTQGVHNPGISHFTTLQNSCDPLLPRSHSKPLPSCWVKHHLTVWLNKGNPGKLMVLLPPLVFNDPEVSCRVYSPWASC